MDQNYKGHSNYLKQLISKPLPIDEKKTKNVNKEHVCLLQPHTVSDCTLHA